METSPNIHFRTDPFFLRLAFRFSNPLVIVPVAILVSVGLYLLISLSFGFPIEKKGLIISSVIPLCVASPVTYFIYLFVKHIEYQRNEIFRQKQQLEKLNQTKSTLLSILSHDLRSPIASLIGLAHGLQSEALSKDVFDQHIDKICDDGDHLLELIDNLLRWSKAQLSGIEPHPEFINISDLISDIVEQTKATAHNKRIRITINTDRQLQAYADPDMMALIIRNLLSNALKFTKEGGHIGIAATRHGENLQISVTDNGQGIKKELVTKLLDTGCHVSTEGTNREKGFGLGLSLCRHFIDVHKGNMTIDSTPGKGSEFTITIPISS